MTPEQLTEAVRKHAKTVLQPSVAQAIVEELTHEQPAQVPEGWRVVYDGDSMPMVTYDIGRLFRVQQNLCGKWTHPHSPQELADRLAAAPQPTQGAMILLNANQLASALEFIAPAFATEPDQRETEVCIQRLPARTSTDGEPMPAGKHAWYADYPDEGCIPLDPGDGNHPDLTATDAAPQPAQVPDGWQLVPKEPTPEMLKAMEINWMWGTSADMAKREYESALKFAPQPKEST